MTKEILELEDRLGFEVYDSLVKGEDLCHFQGNRSLIEFLEVEPKRAKLIYLDKF